jgi:tetratricopeptide (TPR) repeat protein
MWEAPLRWLLVLLVLASGIAAAPAQAARLALVVGVNDYRMIPPLEKAVGDAEAMSVKLKGLGFAVTTVLNPDRRQFNQAITNFRKSLRSGDVAFVHFSGHGVEVDGRNLLLPSDIPLLTHNDEDFLAEEAIDLSSLMERIADSKAAVRIFVVDACRDNPFALKGVRGLGGPGGLGTVIPSRGSFVLYSAGYAQTALDRLGPDDASPTSVYTRVLLDKLDSPGASISEIARDVRAEVAALARTAGHDQFPAYYDELTEDIVLLPSAQGQVRPPADGSVAAVFDRARDLGTASAWEAFLANYPAGVFADLARAALADLPAMGLAAPAGNTEETIDAYSQRQRLQRLWEEAERFERAGDDAQHFRSMSEARGLAAAHFGTDSEEYADASNRIVGALTRMGRLDDAIDASREAIRIYSTLFGEQDLRVLNETGNLAARLASAGQIEEAGLMFESLMAAYEAARPQGWDRVAYAHALEGYGQLAWQRGDSGLAEQYAAQALEIMNDSGFTNSIDYGWVAANYARILQHNGKCEAARAAYRRAAESMKAAQVSKTQPDHAEILAALNSGCP